MWLAALLLGCQDRVLNYVGRVTDISPEVTHRETPEQPSAEPAANEAAEPPAPIQYNPVSVPEVPNTDGFSPDWVRRKANSGPERLITD